MAFCPECQAEMATNAVSCKACNFSFPPAAAAPKSRGWEYSDFAEVSLIVGALSSILAAIVFAYMALGQLAFRMYQAGLLSLLQATISFAMCVVFLRVRK